MASVDAGVEQARIGRVIAVGRKSGSVQEIVKPLGLFVALQRIEEIRRFLRTPQFRNAVERDHGSLHPLHRSAGHQYRTFREDQLSLSHLHVLGPGSLAERGNRCAPVSIACGVRGRAASRRPAPAL